MTTDPAVQSVVNSVVPIHVMIFLFHGVFCASEGILLAQKDLAFLGKMYGIYFAIVPALILQLHRLGSHLQLHHVWYAFMAYQFFRISAWVGRVYFLFRKRKNRASSTQNFYCRYQPNVVKTQEKRQLKKSMALAEAVKRGLK